jgi:hypothetical protein
MDVKEIGWRSLGTFSTDAYVSEQFLASQEEASSMELLT